MQVLILLLRTSVYNGSLYKLVKLFSDHFAISSQKFKRVHFELTVQHLGVYLTKIPPHVKREIDVRIVTAAIQTAKN